MSKTMGFQRVQIPLKALLIFLFSPHSAQAFSDH